MTEMSEPKMRGIEAHKTWVKLHAACTRCHGDSSTICICGPEPCQHCGNTETGNLWKDGCDVCLLAGKHLTDFFAAWHWLRAHPAFYYKGQAAVSAREFASRLSFIHTEHFHGFERSLDVDVVRVCPETNCIEDEFQKNTATRVWLECGPWSELEEHLSEQELAELATHPNPSLYWGMASHDTDLDCGGSTYEEAILALAQLVHDKFGTYYGPGETRGSAPEKYRTFS